MKTLFVTTKEDFMNRSDNDSMKCHISVLGIEVILVNFDLLKEYKDNPCFYFKINKDLIYFISKPESEKEAMDFISKNIPGKIINLSNQLEKLIILFSNLNQNIGVMLISDKKDTQPISIVSEP